jgi:hypothetical protein
MESETSATPFTNSIRITVFPLTKTRALSSRCGWTT